MNTPTNGRIHHRYSGAVLHHTDEPTQRAALESLVAQQQPLPWADLQGADLRGARLVNADLRFANLRGANLTDVDLRFADLTGADLRESICQNTDLYYTCLQGVTFHRAHLSGIKGLEHPGRRGCDLSGTFHGDIKTRMLLSRKCSWRSDRPGAPAVPRAERARLLISNGLPAADDPSDLYWRQSRAAEGALDSLGALVLPAEGLGGASPEAQARLFDLFLERLLLAAGKTGAMPLVARLLTELSMGLSSELRPSGPTARSA